LIVRSLEDSLAHAFTLRAGQIAIPVEVTCQVRGVLHRLPDTVGVIATS
jgi:hypothetical protein